MADRLNYYFRQLVTEAELDEGFDGIEDAIWNLASDFSFFGIVTGAVASEHTPKDLTIDLTAPAVGYDQLGKRTRYGATQNVNMAVDLNGASTAVVGGANEKWLSIHLRFDRLLSDPRTDGNGNTVFFQRQESAVLEVVQGVESPALGSPTADGPPKPTDGMLVCDVKLAFGQTQLANADIDITRRDDLNAFPASLITVASGAWGRLVPILDTVQATFDFIDDRIINRDSGQEITELLIPSTGAETLGGPGANDQWAHAYLSGVTMYGDMASVTTGTHSLGAPTKRWLTGYFDTLTMYGAVDTGGSNQTIGTAVAGHYFAMHTNGITGYAANIDPAVDGTGRLGEDSTPKGWTSGSIGALVADTIEPQAAAATKYLGAIGNKWAAIFADQVIATDLSVGGVVLQDMNFDNHDVELVKALSFNSATALAASINYLGPASVADRLLTITDAIHTETVWDIIAQVSIGGRTVTGWNHPQDGTQDHLLISMAEVPNGATVTAIKLTWYQAAGTATLKLNASVKKIPSTGIVAPVDAGSNYSGEAAGGWVDAQSILAGGSFVMDKFTNSYYIDVFSASDLDNTVVSASVSYTFTDFSTASAA